MSLNRQGEKGIDWTDWSWNPITGCLHNCWYCYAYKLFTRFGRSFEPTFHPERMDELKKLKKPAKVFVCSVADLFATWTPEEWRDPVLDEISKPEYDHLTFQLLTKNPENIRLQARSNIWVGCTVTNQKEMPMIRDLVENYQGFKFVSFEPILGPIDIKPYHWLDSIGWVIIGKLTGSGKIKLDLNWVNKLIYDCRIAGIPIFLKDNLNWHIKSKNYPIST